MKLKFFARDDMLVTVPGSRPMRGQAPQYVGRRFIPGDGKTSAQHPATETPYEADSETDEGRRLVQLTSRDSALWPADKATAEACGVEFVAIDVKDGVAVRASAPVARASAAKRSESAEV
ncbi:MAG TPA: hypothetical protein VFW03_26575 [Gemmatimonadaceae bacterium]|nr:hypothetical protein [Gemmatimonadaceae bacterium]